MQLENDMTTRFNKKLIVKSRRIVFELHDKLPDYKLIRLVSI
jgi:hypothetical protein